MWLVHLPILKKSEKLVLVDDVSRATKSTTKDNLPLTDTAIELAGLRKSNDARQLNNHMCVQDPHPSVSMDYHAYLSTNKISQRIKLSPNKLSQLGNVQPLSKNPYFDCIEEDPTTGTKYILYQEVDQMIVSVSWAVVDKYMRV